MLGWKINIYRETASGCRMESDFVASWMTGLGGTEWLNRLVEDHKAMVIYNGGGYPFRYAVRVPDFLAHLPHLPTAYDGPPVIGDDYVMNTGWRGKMELDRNKLDACRDHDILIVDAWDQS